MKHEYVSAPGQRAAVDLADFRSCHSEYKYLLVYQDYYSKWVELMPLKTKTGLEIAKALIETVFTRYGCCMTLHSDKGKDFVNKIISGVCQALGVKKTTTSGFSPWSNGMVERSNRTIKSVLKCMGRLDKLDDGEWWEKLPYIRMAINMTPHSTTGMTPFKVWMSRAADALMPTDLIYGTGRRDLAPECRTLYVEEQRNKIAAVFDAVTVSYTHLRAHET